MNKKRAALILLAVVLLTPLILAQNESSNMLDKAEACLKDGLGDNCAGSDNTEQLAFSLLAIAHDSSVQQDCKKALLDNKDTDNWNDNIKQTSLAVIALNNIKYNTDDETDWLIEQETTAEDLEWFLEIDADEETECEVDGDKVRIDENKKITQESTSCFSKAQDDYWLKVKSDCYDENFTISCDKEFKTTLLYRRKSGSTYYVSTNTHSASAGDSTEEKINAYCFGSSDCDYESTLWAALALKSADKDINKYLPYLIALKESNGKYLPSAILYILTTYEEYSADLSSLQKSGGYWKVSGNEYYDTALALLALGDKVAETEDWLSNEQSSSSGCWGGIKDTAFLFYALSDKTPASGGGIDFSDCEDAGYYCTFPGNCDDEDILDNYDCNLPEICCKIQPDEKTCAQFGGYKCKTDEICPNDNLYHASDSARCCKVECTAKEISECEEADGFCREICEDDEEETDDACDSSFDVCCTKKEKSSYLWLIILLIILIILVVLTIIFREQLKIWFFRIKNKFRKGPVTQQKRPPFPPSRPGPIQRLIPRQIIPRQFRPPMRAPPRRKPVSKELDETLKKLKDMSK